LLHSSRYGCGVDYARFDVARATEAANICDQTVGGEKRFELNYYISSPSTPAQVQEYIKKHFCGEIIFSEGMYKLFVHASRPAVASFSEKEITNLTLQRPKRKEIFNQVRATFYRQDSGQEDEFSLENDRLVQGLEPLATSSIDLTGCSTLS
jgi:hypothetical protein